jgi:ATP-dependent protease ClpP protease subunit
MKNLLFIILIFFTKTTYSMDFYFTNESPFSKNKSSTNNMLILKGRIEHGDNQKFINFIRSNYKLINYSPGIILSSMGGDIEESFKMAEIIKNLYTTVYVGPYTGKCASACFILYAGAVRRIGHEFLIGIHRPYLTSQRMQELPINEIEKSQEYINNKTKSFLEKNGIARDISDIMLSKSSKEVYWLTESDLYRIGKMPPWFEQYAISKCNYDKELERRVFDAADMSKNSMIKVVNADNCIDSTLANEKEKYLKILIQ